MWQRGKTLATFILVVLVAGVASAGAGSLVGGSKIKKGSIPFNRLDRGTQNRIRALEIREQNEGDRRGPAGPPGPSCNSVAGPNGANGVNGANGTNGKDAKITAFLTTNASDTTPGAWLKRQGTCGGVSDPVGPISIGPNPSSAGGLGANSLLYGPYPDGNAFSGARSHALDGVALKDITEMTFDSFVHPGANAPGDAAVYFRLFLDGGHDVIFSQNTGSQAGKAKPDTWQKWDVLAGSGRYDDDAGNNPDVSMASIIAGHGSEKVSANGLTIFDGCSIANGANAAVDNVSVAAGGQRAVFDFGD